jgi:hypothetical protein
MRLLLLALSLVSPVLAVSASAGPMDLRDPRPRTVSVRFENSPSDAPDRLAATYTADIPASLEPDSANGTVRVRVAGRDVERDWFYRQPLRPGSFSDYVWVFDPRTGDVVEASLRGVLVRRFDFGLFQREVETEFHATLDTRRPAGFGTAHRMFGQLVFPLCREVSHRCTLVPAARYDARTGYVNAVGAIGASAFGVSAQTFAAIGEAIFSERPADRADLASAR